VASSVNISGVAPSAIGYPCCCIARALRMAQRRRISWQANIAGKWHVMAWAVATAGSSGSVASALAAK